MSGPVDKRPPTAAPLALPTPDSDEGPRAGRWAWLEQYPVLKLAALIAAVSWAEGCGKEPPPVTTAKAYAGAARRGDSKAMLELVDARAVAHLEAAAERASDQIGGRRNVEPHEMLQIIDVDPRFQIAKAELVSSDESSATVQLTGTDGSQHAIDLVREDETWRVVVPVPRAPASGS